MSLKRASAGAACLCAALGSACTSLPADYAETLSPQDPKWQTAECQRIRTEAAAYQERELSWAAGALIGPYGLALVAAGKEHQEKQRKRVARDLHTRCSSLPLPADLEESAPAARPT